MDSSVDSLFDVCSVILSSPILACRAGTTSFSVVLLIILLLLVWVVIRDSMLYYFMLLFCWLDQIVTEEEYHCWKPHHQRPLETRQAVNRMTTVGGVLRSSTTFGCFVYGILEGCACTFQHKAGKTTKRKEKVQRSCDVLGSWCTSWHIFTYLQARPNRYVSSISVVMTQILGNDPPEQQDHQQEEAPSFSNPSTSAWRWYSFLRRRKRPLSQDFLVENSTGFA